MSLKDYSAYRYLYPPRPKNAVAPDSLAFYEKRGWWAQFKKNGTCTTIDISPTKDITVMTRHAAEHKAWHISSEVKQALIQLFPEPFWVKLIAEVLHSKTKTIKDTLYIHDVIVWENQILLGSTFATRQNLLDQKLITNVETKTHYVCESSNKIWYAKRYTSGFKQLFAEIRDTSIDEGLVLKNPKGKLESCDVKVNNSAWQVKVRHSTKNYQF